VLITGAGSGLGQALAQRYARAGDRVACVDLDAARAELTRASLPGSGHLAIAANVASDEAMEQMHERIAAEWGGVDVLVNNAGVAAGGFMVEASMAEWRNVIDVNLLGVVRGCRLFLPGMIANGRGQVINTASFAGLAGALGIMTYGVTKVAVVALSDQLRAELHDKGIRVSVLCPAFFVTRILESGRGVVHPQVREKVEEMMRRSRLQAPDVARIAVDGMLRGQLYIVPMRQGRMLWRLQRLWPQGFYRWVLGAKKPPLRDLRKVRDPA
jgi:NADP-dependent 3-hydroxy acid dehydrogenase YdfG